MQRIIPIFYSEYGRYINKFRGIPWYIDCLKPVERRLLLVMHQIAKNKEMPSDRILGECTGKYHPHGSVGVYKTLAGLVHQNLADGSFGEFGVPGLDGKKPSASRYTETKLMPWVEELAFKYVDYVPWEALERDNPEPLFLPSPIPVGLIGDGVITGITFYTTLIPKYKLQDLARRSVWLLENPNKKPEDKPQTPKDNPQEINKNNQKQEDLKQNINSGKEPISSPTNTDDPAPEQLNTTDKKK